MTVHEREVTRLGKLADEFAQAAAPENAQQAQAALAKVFTALAYDGGALADEVEKLVVGAGDLFSNLNPRAGKILSRFGQMAMRETDADSVIVFVSRRGYQTNYNSRLLSDFHNSRDPVSWLTSGGS